MAVKVPQITVSFWIVKVLSTGMGEATSDYLAHRLGPVIAVLLGGAGLTVAFLTQFRSSRYVTAIYWGAVVMVSVFGTMVADGLHVKMGIPYALSTPAFAIALTVIFLAWHRSEGTLSIHSIYTKRRELFYWATVLATFALGTAAGDLAAMTLGLGWLAAGVFFAVVIAIPAAAHRWLGLNSIAAFWFAYIVTRPLGASFADWLALPPEWGGLGLGRGRVSLSLTIVIIACIGYLVVREKDGADRFAANSPKRGRHRRQTARPRGW
jgi:uncharacterized membrane-anchored protein